MATNQQPRRFRLTFARAKDSYCFCCEDGGQLVDCCNSACHRAYCYDEVGANEDEQIQDGAPACVTIPPGLLQDSLWRFRCPECLLNDPTQTIDYFINRGYRNTRRLSSRASVGIIVHHLSSMKGQAYSVTRQVMSALGGLEVNMSVRIYQLPNGVPKSDVAHMHASLLPEAPYHLVVLIATESDPRGGWWQMSDLDAAGRSSVSERSILSLCLSPLGRLAKDAVSSRVFVIACGTNIFVKPEEAGQEPTLQGITGYLKTHPWHSLVLPTVKALHVAEYLLFFPELFVELYYYSTPLRSALLRCWAKSREARSHTGLILMAKSDQDSRLIVSRFEYGAKSVRPHGVYLPMPASICGCWDKSPRWKPHYDSISHGERFYFLVSTCCRLELHLAVFVGDRRVIEMHGTTIVEEPWRSQKDKFDLDDPDNVSWRVSKARSTQEMDKRPRHTSPWTEVGRRATSSVQGFRGCRYLAMF
ncbi:hypothetical protein BDV93DRAFT_564255 [Ceratobasidium sp. AG-I]|nr:hypothetical protein BDV93DRAFT_564255 [Ceratobasidium sp. AG-I]